MTASHVIRVAIPFHLRNLARVTGDITIELSSSPTEPVTLRRVLDAVEKSYPMLRGTIRDHGTLTRRPFLRYFACGKDFSLESHDAPLPNEVVNGAEPFIVLGSIAGG